MKRIFSLMVVLITLIGCKDDIEFNTPALQGDREGDLWRSTYNAADIDFGGWVIEGGNSVETVQLITTNDVRGTFVLGGDSPNVAIYRDADGVVYSTANAPDESLTIYPADGEIIVEDINNTAVKTVEGTFWFNAYTADGLNRINFNNGVFHKVPLLGGLERIAE